MMTEASSSFEFRLNGVAVRVNEAPATTTLLHWLRATGRTGSKCGCDEGDCGACTVALVEKDAAGKPTYRAINSCIALLPMFAGREVVTVEGLEEAGAKSPESRAHNEKLHPVQAAMVEHYGSQCGYCTPGFVMSLFEAYHRDGAEMREPGKICDQLCGNLCRCTGYRPIRDAAVAVLAGPRGGADDPLAHADGFGAELNYGSAGEVFLRPASLAELLELRAAKPEAALVAGATEIGVELNKKFRKFPVLISVEGVAELTRIVKTEAAWRIGAAATLTAIEDTVAAEFPSLAQMLAVFAARQIRNRATLGGNLVTASPIGDSAPVLLTLDASVVLASAAGGERVVKLEDFFVGYRKTVLRADEAMKEVVVPRRRTAGAVGGGGG